MGCLSIGTIMDIADLLHKTDKVVIVAQTGEYGCVITSPRREDLDVQCWAIKVLLQYAQRLLDERESNWVPSANDRQEIDRLLQELFNKNGEGA